MPLDVRFTRQSLVIGLRRDSSVAAATELVESYFEAVLSIRVLRFLVYLGMPSRASFHMRLR